MTRIVAAVVGLGPDAHHERGLCVAGGLLIAALFAWDLLVPNGVAAGEVFVLPVLLGFAIGTRRYALASGAVATVLCLLGWVIAPPMTAPDSYVLVNRGIAIIVIWATTAALLTHLAATEQAALERARRQEGEHARQLAEAALRESETHTRLGRMTAAIAHEVRNPLAAILGALQVLDARVTPSDRPVLRSMHDRLQVLARSMDDLLALADSTPMVVAPVRASILLQGVRDLLAADRRTARSAIEVATEADAELRVDAPRVQGAVLQMVLTAVHAGARSVAVKGRLHPEGYAIVVVDDGPGIADELRAHVQDLFDEGPRAGLGLAIAHRTARGHGGRLEIGSPEHGAELTLVLSR